MAACYRRRPTIDAEFGRVALTVRQRLRRHAAPSGAASTLPGPSPASVHPAYANRCRPTFLLLRGEDLEEAQWLMSFPFSKVRRSMTMQPK